MRIPILPVAVLCLLAAAPATAGDRLCDTAYENCREPLLDLINNERVAIDVAFWFMEDARYTAALARKMSEGVPVRVLMDTRANSSYPHNATRLDELRAAGIPMRRRVASGILHWKMMLFAGQRTVQFSAANYSDSFVPYEPYVNYIDEVVYFTDQASIVGSFQTQFDTLWIDESRYADYANVVRPLLRAYDQFPKDGELNFPPNESYRNRAVARYDAETVGIDVTMYRITDRAHTDAMIRALARGVPVRLLTEPKQYRDPSRYWHAWNVDRLYAAGAQIRHRAHAGLMHQKSVILQGQGLTIFGSSNWTSPSSNSQEEHNYFTYKPFFFTWFTSQFARKWTNGAGYVETEPFRPLPPDAPQYVSPADLTQFGEVTSATLRWNGGLWAHLYDIYFGTMADPPLLEADVALGPSTHGSDTKSFTVSGLEPGRTYYWRIVGKTMAGETRAGAVHSFSVGGTPLPQPAGDGDIVLHAAGSAVVHGNWVVRPDATAAGGARLENPDAGLPKVSTALAAPADYVELTFTADAGRAYHLWIRGRADRDYYGNDSVHVQFSGAVDSGGAPTWRIGTTSAAAVVVEAGNGAGLAGWGWTDNGWGTLGSHVYFATSGAQTIRIQRREDGISIDQVVLSPATYLTSPPGARKGDSTILEASGGEGGTEPPPEPDPDPPPSDPTLAAGEVVLYAARAAITGGDWTLVTDSSAASGAALRSIDRGASKIVTASAAPASYAEIAYTVEAGKPYRLWLRSRAEGDYWGSDSVHVQFSNAVDSSGAPVFRIGTTESAVVNLEDCSGCGLRGWGWQDNGWGVGVLGPVIYFPAAGTGTLRIQNREDGLRIDQIVLSPATWLEAAPGALKDDTTHLPASAP